MILVLLGTQDKSFKRLIEAVEKQVINKNIKEKVIVQAGTTKYESKYLEIFDLLPEEELTKLIQESSLVITHGGVASILTALKNNKKVIAAARLKEYKEHDNDHQLQIIKEFKSEKYILELKDFDKLDLLLKESKEFKQKKYKSNNKKFITDLTDYIKEDNHTNWLNKIFKSK